MIFAWARFSKGLSGEQVKKTLAGLADGSLEIGDNGIGGVTSTNEKNVQVSGKKYSLIGVAEDGRKIYEGNFPKAHRVLLTNGEEVRGDIKNNAEPTVDSITKENSRKRLSISSASNNSIPQNPEKSTENAKKSFSFDPEAFIQQSLENGGMVEKPKSQTIVKKTDTEAKLKAKVDELKEDNARLERKARVSERKAKTAEKREAATSERMESEKAKEVKRIATSVKRLVNDFSFLVNEATHRKYTVGGAVGATILADPAIQAFAAYFAKRGSAYSIMNKSTRDGVKHINIVSRTLLVFSVKLPYSV